MVKQLRQSIRTAKILTLLRKFTPVYPVRYLLVSNVDRFGRDVQNMIILKKQLEAYGTAIIATQTWNRSDLPTGNMEFRQQAMVAELFSIDRSIRVKSAKSVKRSLGNFMGGQPTYGSQVKLIDGVRIVFDSPAEQAIIKRIVKMKSQEPPRTGLSIN